MAMLSDTQNILLSTASQRENGSVYPLPATITCNGGISRSLTALQKAGYIKERDTHVAEEVRRSDGDLRFGLYVTAAGLSAIGVEPDEQETVAAPDPAAVDTSPAAAAAPKPPRITKAAAVLALLQRSDGATLAELIDATGWLPHTTRAALTGLKKKGHSVERFKRDGVTCYRVNPA